MNSWSSGRDVGWLRTYDLCMRYAQRGGYTPAGQQRRERPRLEAAGRFARDDTIREIAHGLRVTEGPVRRWHRALSAPLVWCRDNLRIRLAPELADAAAE